YSKNGGPNLDVFLRGHPGDDLRVDRKGRSELVRHPALTVILAPQPAVLRALVKESEFRDRGLLARFLYSLPQSRVGFRRFVLAPVPQDVRHRYERTIRRILEVPLLGTDEPGYALDLAPEALETWRNTHDEIEVRQREGGDLRCVGDWASKAAGAA